MMRGATSGESGQTPVDLAEAGVPGLVAAVWISWFDALSGTDLNAAAGVLGGLTFAVKDNMDAFGLPPVLPP